MKSVGRRFGFRRALLLGAMASLPAGLPAGALAQQDASALDRRVSKLESEVRAVQRKVFPGGGDRYFEPEFKPQDQAAPTDVPATTPLADMTARVDSLERQLANITGQVEQNGFQLRQLQEQLAKFRGDAEFRLTQLEGGGAAGGAAAPAFTPSGAPAPGARAARPPAGAPGSEPPPPAAVLADGGPATPVAPTPPAAANGAEARGAAPAAASADPVEEEWKAAYALVTAKQYDRAAPALQAILDKYPAHERAASAQFWLGRTYYAENSHALAAKAFLSSYQKYPKALRAPDSLYWLGQSLVGLKQPQEACRAYDELEAAYGSRISPTLKQQVEKARSDARCAA